MIDIDNWLNPLNKGFHRHKRTVRKFKLGGLEVRVWNYDNEELQIDEVKFQIATDGELQIYTTGQTTLNSLQELKDKVNLYKKSYLLMLETQKQMKMLGDF